MSYERIEKMNNNYNTVSLCITMNTMLYNEFTGRNTGYYVLLCILCYTMLYYVIQCITVKYNGV